MPEKKKKLRLYKFAAEYNLSTDSLMEYLQEKGHNVKSHMSLLTDGMLADIQSKYKKEMEKAETHYRKVTEFHKKRVEKRQDEPSDSEDEQDTSQEVSEIVVKDQEIPEEKPEEKVEEKTEAKEKAEEPAEVQNEEKPAVEEEKPKAVEESSEESKIEEKPVKQEKSDELSEPEEEKIQQAEDKKEAAKHRDKSGEIFKTESERKMEQNSQGLTILGKMDLNKKKKSTDKKEDRPGAKKFEKNKKEEPAKDGKATVPQAELFDGDPNKKGKPKKGKKGKPDEVVENELPAKKKWKKKKGRVDEPEVVDDKPNKKGKKKRKSKKPEVDKVAVDQAIKKTMLGLDANTPTAVDRASLRRKKRKEKAELEEIKQEELAQEEIKLKVTEFISVSELANLMNVPVADVIAKCMSMGLMVSINQRLDVETIELVADEFGFEVEFQEEYKADEIIEEEEPEELLKERPPVVTIMGHVDHGKTSLLDQIRSENVVAGEAGGITQHIGAYKVEVNGKYITFLDTPGHEAFTAMRARGASVTDIVILIVSADDAVMPQTIEAINHAQAASVPIIVAINKIDKPGANSERIRQQLADRNILVEDWGGKYQCAEISAKQGLNIDTLLDKILLESEMLELKANPDRTSVGTVIESQLDKGRGVTSTVLIQKGSLKVGQPFVAGIHHGRVRAMFDERNKKVDEVGPSTPVLLLGFEGRPQAGDTFTVMNSEREARELSLKRQQLKREQDFRQHSLVTLDEIAAQAGKGKFKELPIIVKGDMDGSVEAIADSMMKLTNDECTVKVIHKGVGAISESDVILAQASGAIIIGFHVRPHTPAKRLAEKENVEIRLYNVIYDAINEVKSALEGLLDPVISERNVATIEIRDTFKVPKLGTVAGCYVTDGRINRNQKIRLFREGIVIYEGSLASLKRFKDDVKEVDAGYECGLNIQNFNDVKIGDVIEAYEMVEEKKKLEL